MSALDTRRVSRDSLFLMADLAVEGRSAVRIKVRNLSDCGMMGEGEIEIASGNRIVVDLRNIGKVSGKVAWARDNRFGLSFDRIIDPKRARAPVGTGFAQSPRYARPAIDPSAGPFDPAKLRTV